MVMERLRKNYLKLIIQTYSTQREKYNYLMDNKNEMDQILKEGSKKGKKSCRSSN